MAGWLLLFFLSLQADWNSGIDEAGRVDEGLSVACRKGDEGDIHITDRTASGGVINV